MPVQNHEQMEQQQPSAAMDKDGGAVGAVGPFKVLNEEARGRLAEFFGKMKVTQCLVTAR